MGGRRATGGLLLVLALATAAAGQAPQRYSGKVERVELDPGMVVVNELGARGRQFRREVHVGPDTPIVSAGRLPPWQMRGPRAYGEVPVSLADVLIGDYVVVEAVEEAGRTLALRITIVETPPPRPRRP
ncbi:MAG TPA: hypothetical protein VLD61_08690 [Methylomirabilota bacterium]|nr:hypothetical protein [Methylomirabilota bacterium]